MQLIIPLSVRYSHADVQRGACLGNEACFYFLLMLRLCFFSLLNLNLTGFTGVSVFHNILKVSLSSWTLHASCPAYDPCVVFFCT